MSWFFAAAFLCLLLLAIDEANGLRMRLVDQQVALDEQTAELAAARRALAAIDERRRSAGLPARLSCAVHSDRVNGRPITVYRN